MDEIRRKPMRDFTEVTDISDNARIIGLQDNENVKIPLQSLTAKILSRADEDILTVNDINVEGGVTGFNPIGQVAEGDKRAVSGDEVYGNVIKKSDLGYSGNIFDTNNVVNGSYISGDGSVVVRENTSYGFIKNINTDDNDLVTLFVPATQGNSRRVVFLGENNIIIDVYNAYADEVSVIPLPKATREIRFTINPPARENDANINDIAVSYGSELVRSRFVGSVNGVDIQGNVLKKKLSKNLVNPLETHVDSVFNNGYDPSNIYNSTGFIPVNGIQTLYVTTNNVLDLPIRVFSELNADGVQTKRSSPGYYDKIETTRADTAYIVAVFLKAVSPENLCITTDISPFVEFGYEGNNYYLSTEQNVISDNSIITKKNLDDALSSASVGTNTIVTFQNTDKILDTGSSSYEGFYNPDKKTFQNRLQDFLDIMYITYGFSGKNANEIADRLNSDVAPQYLNGVKPSEIKPTYVIVGQTLNSSDMLSDLTDESFINSNRNLLISAMARTKAIPIISTAYRTEKKPWIENSLLKLAKEFNAGFMPFGTYTSDFIRNNKYIGFYGSGHPGIRTNESYTLPMLDYLQQLPRPNRGILVFEPREEKTVLELNYLNTNERAVLFQSIQVGEMALGEDYQDRYDRMQDTGYTINKVNTSDYMKLFKRQEVALKNNSLIEIIIPNINVDSLNVLLDASGIESYHLFNPYTKSFEQVTALEDISNDYVDFDKLKIIIGGQNIVLKDVKCEVIGGVEKPKVTNVKVNPPKGGRVILPSEGITTESLEKWSIGANVVSNLTTKFNSSTFNDMPLYLGEDKDIITITEPIGITCSVENETTFGYKTLRIWTCARLNPKIYDPVRYAEWDKPEPIENPYTDVSWYNENSYDYDNLSVEVTYIGVADSNKAKSINYRKVGLFWTLLYTDVIIPITRDGDYRIVLRRNTNNTNHPMEFCDLSVEIL